MTTLDTILNGALLRLDDPPTDLLPDDGPGDPIPGDPGYEYPRCDFCASPAHFGACDAMLAFVERLKIRRLCPTCGAEMQRAGARAWICPNQRDQGNGISLDTRAKSKAISRERVAFAPF